MPVQRRLPEGNNRINIHVRAHTVPGLIDVSGTVLLLPAWLPAVSDVVPSQLTDGPLQAASLGKCPCITGDVVRVARGCNGIDAAVADNVDDTVDEDLDLNLCWNWLPVQIDLLTASVISQTEALTGEDLRFALWASLGLKLNKE